MPDIIASQYYNPPRPEGLHVLTTYTLGENKMVELYQKVDPKHGTIDFISPGVFHGHDVFQMTVKNPQNGQPMKVDQQISFPIRAVTILDALANFKGARQDAVHALFRDMRMAAIAAGARAANLPSLTPDE